MIYIIYSKLKDAVCADTELIKGLIFRYLQEHGAADGACERPFIHRGKILIPVKVAGRGKKQKCKFIKRKAILHVSIRLTAWHNIFPSLITAHVCIYFLLIPEVKHDRRRC